MLPSNGTLNVAPSPTTSKMFAVRILSLRGRSVRGTLTPFGSAAALTSIEREPAISVTGYALPRSSRHFEEFKKEEQAVCIPNKVYIEIVG